MRAGSISCLLALPLVVFACATGSTPSEGDLFDDGGTSSGQADAAPPSDSPYQTYGDTGTSSGADSGGKQPPADSGTTTTKDSGTTTTPDTGPPDTGTTSGNGDCVGQQSQQLTAENGGASISYDQACDNYFQNTFGNANPCTPGANQCASLNNSTYTFCCYKPAPGSNCDFDYFGDPQCLPK